MTELLRRALSDAQLAEDEVALRLGVDPKTVRRWIGGRRPYPRHRSALAALLGIDARNLWPELVQPAPRSEPPTSEILMTYSHRWAVPRGVWQRLFEGAKHEICILAYAGLFLAEDSGLLRILADQARSGVRVRIALGDPDGLHITQRGADEGLGDALSAKIRNALVLYQPLSLVEGVEIRLHDTVLYNSIYRADDDLMINPHAYGIAAAHAPVLYLRTATPGDMAATYIESFERAWRTASPG